MRHVWQVSVRDHEGNPVQGAVVAIQAEAELTALGLGYPYLGAVATHADQGAGRYESSSLELSVGAWLLLVQAAGKSPVVQPLDMRANARGEVDASPPLTKLAKTVSFSAETVRTALGAVRATRFVVTLFPAAEVVLFSGTEYHSAGTCFHLFALGRRDVLFREKLVDAGTLITLVSCDHRGIGTYVKAHRGFLEVRALPSPPGAPGRAHVEMEEDHADYGAKLLHAGVMSVTALYRYLSAVGEQRPGTVKETSIFSHSWEDGPLLYNSYEVLPGQKNDVATPPRPERFELDFDGRAKDFLTENVDGPNGWPHMKDAFAKDAVFRMWGCNANARYRKLLHDAKANDAKDDDAVFVSSYTSTSKPRQRRERGLNGKVAVAAAYHLFSRPHIYLAAAARYLGVTTMGAAPGAGSEFHVDKGIPFMRVVPTDWGATYPYFEKHFGPELKPTTGSFDQGYVAYSAVISRAEPPGSGPNSGLYNFVVNLDPIENQPRAWISFDSDLTVVLDDVGYRVKSDALTLNGKQGHRFVLQHRTTPRAFFAADGGGVFELQKGKTGHFDVLGAKVEAPKP